MSRWHSNTYHWQKCLAKFQALFVKLDLNRVCFWTFWLPKHVICPKLSFIPAILFLFCLSGGIKENYFLFFSDTFLVLKVIFAFSTAIIAWGHPFPKGLRYIGSFFLLMTWIEVIWHDCMWRGWAKIWHQREALRTPQ